jgi:hypothetical protein
VTRLQWLTLCQHHHRTLPYNLLSQSHHHFIITAPSQRVKEREAEKAVSEATPYESRTLEEKTRIKEEKENTVLRLYDNIGFSSGEDPLALSFVLYLIVVFPFHYMITEQISQLLVHISSRPVSSTYNGISPIRLRSASGVFGRS